MKTKMKLNIKSITILASFILLGLKVMAGDGKFHSIKIKVRYNNAKPNDTLILESFDTMNYFKPRKDTATVNTDGLFYFNLVSDQRCGYWQLNVIDRSKSYSKSGNYIFRALSIPFFWENGDDLKLDLTNKPTYISASSIYKFSGKGAQKYNIRGEIFNTKLSKEATEQWGSKMNNDKVFDSLYNYIQPRNPLVAMQEMMLEKDKDSISFLSYNVLRADIIFQDGGFENFKIKKYYKSQIEPLNRNAQSIFIEKFKNFSFLEMQTVLKFKDLSESYNAIPYIINRMQTSISVLEGKEDPIRLYESLKINTTGRLREALILCMLLSKKNSVASDSIYKDAGAIMMTTYGKERFADIGYLFLRNIGLKNYSLTDSNDNLVNLNDLRGKVLVLDFWFTGCHACAQYYKTVLSKVESQFKNNNGIVFLSISVDRKMDYWLKGLNTGIYTGMYGLHLFTSGKGFEHPILKDNNITRFPTVMLIDKAGKIRAFNSEDLYTVSGLSSILTSSSKE